ncbi:MAG: CIA30 family protein [Flavobacteriaceae bacterium]|nr:CIA30 family protein [Flavobacteriaceae bacterium]
MKILTSSLLLILMISSTQKIDFGNGKDGQSWQVVNDGVMGGRSQGSKMLTENSMVFWGEVSLENNGGFSSLRSNFSSKQLSQFEKVSLRYRSKGISLAMTFSVSNRWYVPNYKFSLASTGGEWSMITINLNQFRKHYIGKPMNEMLDQEVLKKVIRMGFITDEKKYGSFEFEVDYIEFV